MNAFGSSFPRFSWFSCVFSLFTYLSQRIGHVSPIHNQWFCVLFVYASQRIWAYIPESYINCTCMCLTCSCPTVMCVRGEVPAPSRRMVAVDTCVRPAIAVLLAVLRRCLVRPAAMVLLPGGSTASFAPTAQPAPLWLPGNPLSAPQVRDQVSGPQSDINCLILVSTRATRGR